MGKVTVAGRQWVGYEMESMRDDHMVQGYVVSEWSETQPRSIAITCLTSSNYHIA